MDPFSPQRRRPARASLAPDLAHKLPAHCLSSARGTPSAATFTQDICGPGKYRTEEDGNPALNLVHGTMEIRHLLVMTGSNRPPPPFRAHREV